MSVGIGDEITNSHNPEKYVDCMLIEDNKSKYARLYMVGDKNERYNKMLKLIAREYLQETGYKTKATYYRKTSRKSPKRARKRHHSLMYITMKCTP